MKGTYQYRLLHDKDTPLLYSAFKSAYVDAPGPVTINLTQFERAVRSKVILGLGLSAGVFYGEELVGFLLNGTLWSNQAKMAYTICTGVVPKHRNNRLVANLFHYLFPFFKQAAIKHCCLEVLLNHQKAFMLYRRLGFYPVRHMATYVLKSEVLPAKTYAHSPQIHQTIPNSENNYEDFHDYKPALSSFVPGQVSPGHHEILAEAHVNGDVAGYIVYQPACGYIRKLAVHPALRRQGIGTALLKYAYDRCANRRLVVPDVEQNQGPSSAFYASNGFEVLFVQVEMHTSRYPEAL